MITHFNNNMATKQSIISKDVTATNLAIMCYMAGPHYKIIVTNNLKCLLIDGENWATEKYLLITRNLNTVWSQDLEER